MAPDLGLATRAVSPARSEVHARPQRRRLGVIVRTASAPRARRSDDRDPPELVGRPGVLAGCAPSALLALGVLPATGVHDRTIDGSSGAESVVHHRVVKGVRSRMDARGP